MKEKKEQWKPQVNCFRKDGQKFKPEDCTIPISFKGVYQILAELKGA